MLLAGCSNEYAQSLRKSKSDVTARLATLGQQLDAGKLSNGRLIGVYAEKLAAAKPDLGSVTDLLAKDATSAGPLPQPETPFSKPDGMMILMYAGPPKVLFVRLAKTPKMPF